jgi:nitroreductase
VGRLPPRKILSKLALKAITLYNPTAKAIEKQVKAVANPVCIKDVQLADIKLTDSIREAYISKVFDAYQSFEVVVTDRFHAAVFSSLTGTPCVALNSQIPKKISGYRDFLPNIQFIRDPQDIPQAIAKAKASNRRTSDFSYYFANFRNIIQEELEKVQQPEVEPENVPADPDGVFALLTNRRSHRKWIDAEVEENKMQKILTAGMYAPSAANHQATRFIVVSDKKRIGEVCKYASPWFKNSHPNKIVMVLFDTAKKHIISLDFKNKRHPWMRFLWQDTSAATMNMITMAEAQNIKSCYVSITPPEYGDQEKQIRQVLGIPERYVLTCMLFLGYSDRKIDVATARHQGKPIRRNRAEYILTKS